MVVSQADITMRALRKCQYLLWSALPGYLLQKILASRRRARLRGSLSRENSDRFLAIASCTVMVYLVSPQGSAWGRSFAAKREQQIFG